MRQRLGALLQALGLLVAGLALVFGLRGAPVWTELGLLGAGVVAFLAGRALAGDGAPT